MALPMTRRGRRRLRYGSIHWKLAPNGRVGHPITVMTKGNYFFDKYGLSDRDIERYLSAALSAGGDFADLYFEYHTTTSISVDESMVKSATQGISVGCGVRVIAGERTGYAYTDDLSPERLQHAA